MPLREARPGEEPLLRSRRRRHFPPARPGPADARALLAVEAEGELVSACAVTGQTAEAAIIGAVFTPERHRRKGYAPALVCALSAALLASGRRPCLFYHDPAAGRIYQRLGFIEIGNWQ